MFFYRRPEEFFRFYRDKMICDTAKPNAAHLKLAELEHAGKVKAIVTEGQSWMLPDLSVQRKTTNVLI